MDLVALRIDPAKPCSVPSAFSTSWQSATVWPTCPNARGNSGRGHVSMDPGDRICPQYLGRIKRRCGA
jgi:hypothetical protein